MDISTSAHQRAQQTMAVRVKSFELAMVVCTTYPTQAVGQIEPPTVDKVLAEAKKIESYLQGNVDAQVTETTEH